MFCMQLSQLVSHIALKIYFHKLNNMLHFLQQFIKNVGKHLLTFSISGNRLHVGLLSLYFLPETKELITLELIMDHQSTPLNFYVSKQSHKLPHQFIKILSRIENAHNLYIFKVAIYQT